MSKVLTSIRIGVVLVLLNSNLGLTFAQVPDSGLVDDSVLTTTTTTTVVVVPSIQGCGVGRDGTALGCGRDRLEHVPATVTGVSESGTSSSDSSASDRIYVAYERIIDGGGPNGEACTTTGYREMPAGVDPAVGAIPDRDFRDISRTYPVCPAQPGTETEPETAATFALRYWQ